MTDTDRRLLAPEVSQHEDLSFRDGFTIGAAVASSIALGCGLIALFVAIWCGEF